MATAIGEVRAEDLEVGQRFRLETDDQWYTAIAVNQLPYGPMTRNRVEVFVEGAPFPSFLLPRESVIEVELPNPNWREAMSRLDDLLRGCECRHCTCGMPDIVVEALRYLFQREINRTEDAR